MSRQESNERPGEDSSDAGHPMALDPAAETANPELPAFLAKPDGAPPYHGFPILDGVEVDGWRIGLISDSMDTDDIWGDAYLIAPDGRRAGVVWQAEQPFSCVELIGPDADRFGVFQVNVANRPTSHDSAGRFLNEILAPIIDAWQKAKR